MPAGQTPITLVGSIGQDPEIREAGSSRVASFSVAVTERKKVGDTWEDGATTWFKVSAWDQLGENVAATLSKGMRVVVTGTIAERKYVDKDQNERSTWETTADDVSVSLKYATAQVTRIPAGARGQQQQRGQRPAVQQQQPQQRPADTWSAPGAYDDETPF